MVQSYGRRGQAEHDHSGSESGGSQLSPDVLDTDEASLGDDDKILLGTDDDGSIYYKSADNDIILVEDSSGVKQVFYDFDFGEFNLNDVPIIGPTFIRMGERGSNVNIIQTADGHTLNFLAKDASGDAVGIELKNTGNGEADVEIGQDARKLRLESGARLEIAGNEDSYLSFDPVDISTTSINPTATGRYLHHNGGDGNPSGLYKSDPANDQWKGADPDTSGVTIPY